MRTTTQQQHNKKMYHTQKLSMVQTTIEFYQENFRPIKTGRVKMSTVEYRYRRFQTLTGL